MTDLVSGGRSLSQTFSVINRLIDTQELKDYQFEKPHLSIPGRLSLYMFNQTAQDIAPCERMKGIYKPKCILNSLITKPISAIYVTFLRVFLLASTPLVFGVAFYESLERRSVNPIKKATGEILQLTSIFVRGVLRIVPIIGPLLGRAWTIITVALAACVSKVMPLSCIKCEML